VVDAEEAKGCLPNLAPCPVALEPPFTPLLSPRDLAKVRQQPLWTPEEPSPEEDLVRLHVRVAPRQPLEQLQDELRRNTCGVCASHSP
jgi:hypothetical protein